MRERQAACRVEGNCLKNICSSGASLDSSSPDAGVHAHTRPESLRPVSCSRERCPGHPTLGSLLPGSPAWGSGGWWPWHRPVAQRRPRIPFSAGFRLSRWTGPAVFIGLERVEWLTPCTTISETASLCSLPLLSFTALLFLLGLFLKIFPSCILI